MIVKKPRNIDFSAVKDNMEKQISLVQELIDLHNADISRLEEKPDKTTDDKRKLAAIKLGLQAYTEDLAIKKEVFQEYMERVAMQMIINERDRQDYIANFKTTLAAAKSLKNDIFLSAELKVHLKEVLTVDINRFTEAQKISWHLALKKEVEICRNYRKSNR